MFKRVSRSSLMSCSIWWNEMFNEPTTLKLPWLLITSKIEWKKVSSHDPDISQQPLSYRFFDKLDYWGDWYLIRYQLTQFIPLHFSIPSKTENVVIANFGHSFFCTLKSVWKLNERETTCKKVSNKSVATFHNSISKRASIQTWWNMESERFS